MTKATVKRDNGTAYSITMTGPVKGATMWEYRVLKVDEDYFTLAEVYYNEDDSILGVVYPVEPFGETEVDLKLDLAHYMRAFAKPVLSPPYVTRRVSIDEKDLKTLLLESSNKELWNEYSYLLR